MPRMRPPRSWTLVYLPTWEPAGCLRISRRRASSWALPAMPRPNRASCPRLLHWTSIHWVSWSSRRLPATAPHPSRSVPRDCPPLANCDPGSQLRSKGWWNHVCHEIRRNGHNPARWLPGDSVRSSTDSPIASPPPPRKLSTVVAPIVSPPPPPQLSTVVAPITRRRRCKPLRPCPSNPARNPEDGSPLCCWSWARLLCGTICTRYSPTRLVSVQRFGPMLEHRFAARLVTPSKP